MIDEVEILEKIGSNYVLAKTKYGIHKCKKCHIDGGHVPTILTAIDKNKYFENQAKDIHGDKYDYSQVDYINARTKVKLLCKIHGEFYVTPNAHISKGKHGAGCQMCSKDNFGISRRNSLEYFINKSNIVHNNFYDYSKTSYVKQSVSTIIICPKHGEFTQVPKDHLRGSGCPKCRVDKISKARSENPTGWEYSRWIKHGKSSEDFDGFSVYIIECFDDNERFIKIGRTYRSVAKRFRTKEMLPYSYEILGQIFGDGEYICNLERDLKNLYKDFVYLPMKHFNGKCECFSLDIKKKLMAIPR